MSYTKHTIQVPPIGHYILVKDLEMCPFDPDVVNDAINNGMMSKSRTNIEERFTQHPLKLFKRTGDFYISIPKRTTITMRKIDDSIISVDINKTYNKDNEFGFSQWTPTLRLFHGVALQIECLYLKRSDHQLIGTEKKKTQYIIDQLGHDI